MVPYEHGQGSAWGYSRWVDAVLDEVFGAPQSSPKYPLLRESLLALDANEGVSSHLFVTLNEDLLAHRDWLQDRMSVFIVSLAEALDFVDLHLKRKGIYAYRASSHVQGKQGYYFQRVCKTIPSFPLIWASCLFGEAELPNGQAVQRYLESFHLRLVSMFEAKDRIADQFYRRANNDTLYLMLRELNTFFPLATGSFDALAWLCRYLYQFRAGDSERDWELRRRVIFKLKLGKTTNGLINQIGKANQPLGELLHSKDVQSLLGVFYPARDSIQHRHPLAGVQYIWVEDRGMGIITSSANEKAYSLAILDEDTAQAIAALDQQDAADYFSQWGVRISGSHKLLEPYKFITKALKMLCEFYNEFFERLDIASYPSLSNATRQDIQGVEKAQQEQGWRAFAIPFFLDRGIPMIAGGLAQITAAMSGHGTAARARDKLSEALYGTHTAIIDISKVEGR